MTSPIASPAPIDRDAQGAPRARPLAIARWLHFVAALVVAMVVVGGITRLTESGLSITRWDPVAGAIPPLTPADWERAFALYRETTEYRTVNSGMTLGQFKQIYFWEWAHRLLGRVIGLAFALPLAWFWVRRAIPAGYKPRLIALLALGGLQGAIGWWMVSSGLVGRVDVSHYRLTVHLMLAFLILAGLVWTARDLRASFRAGRPVRAPLVPVAAAALTIFALQLVWGALTAGLDAGLASSDWPMMTATDWQPPAALSLAAWIDSPVHVQFVHRWFAFIAAAALIWLAVRALRTGARGPAIALKTLVAAQLVLGIATVMSRVELGIAVAHQLVAALLVMAATLCAHAVGTPESTR